MCVCMVWLRPSGPIQGFPKPDMSSPPSVYNMPPGYGRSMSRPPQFMSQLSPTSLSRLGQPPFQRTNHGRSSVTHGNEGNHIKSQNSSFSYDPGNPHSLGGSSFNNSTPWGKHRFDLGFLSFEYYNQLWNCLSAHELFPFSGRCSILIWHLPALGIDIYKYLY